MSHLPRVVGRQSRGLLDGGADASVGSAAAEIAAHGRVDVLIGRLGILAEQRSRCHHLTRLAIAALHHIEREPCGLHALADLAVADTFDCHDRRVANTRYRRNARACGHAVKMYRASATKGHATAKLRAFEADLIAQHPQKGRVPLRLDGTLSAVHRDRKGHVWLPFSVACSNGRALILLAPSARATRNRPATRTARRGSSSAACGSGYTGAGTCGAHSPLPRARTPGRASRPESRAAGRSRGKTATED